jgi:hypothetical protein
MVGKDSKRWWGRTEKDAGEGQEQMQGKDRKRCWGRTEKDAGEGQEKMQRKDRKRCWGKTEKDGGEEQKKMLVTDKKRCRGRTEKDAGEGKKNTAEGQKKMLGKDRQRCWGRTDKDAGDGQKKTLTSTKPEACSYPGQVSIDSVIKDEFTAKKVRRKRFKSARPVWEGVSKGEEDGCRPPACWRATPLQAGHPPPNGCKAVWGVAHPPGV